MSSIGFSAALVLGATFLLSGAGKLRDPAGFALAAVEYDVVPPRLASACGRLVPLAELACGWALLLGLARTVAAALGLLLLTSFFTAVLVNLARGRRIKCHCFGQGGDDVLGWVTVARLWVLLGCAAAILAWRGGRPLTLPPAALPDALLALALLVGLYLLRIVPQTWENWLTRGQPAPTLHGGRVSLRDRPLAPATAGYADAAENGAGQGGRCE